MAGYKNLKKIDGEKLKQLVVERGLTLAELSRDCGFGDGYFSNSARRNELNNVGINYLERIGIPFEWYAYKEPTDEPTIEYIPEGEMLLGQMTVDEFFGRLENAMYKAFYSALEHATVKTSVKAWHSGNGKKELEE